MAQTLTLLDGVNNALKRVNVIRGDTEAFTSLTDPAHQHDLDLMVQLWNEAIAMVYTLPGKPLPRRISNVTITLIQDQRNYPLPVDCEQIRFPLMPLSNEGGRINEYRGGYERMRWEQLHRSQYKGIPNYGVMDPRTRELLLDRAPIDDAVGREYDLEYNKVLTLSQATDQFAFDDSAVLSMVPVIAEAWRQNETGANRGFAPSAFGRTARIIRSQEKRSMY